MSMEKQLKLASLLIKRTNEGKLDWESTIKDDVFSVSFSRNTARIRERHRSEDDEVDIVIDLLNDEGTIVETFSDVELTDADTTANARWYTKMKDLYDKARRRALGSDKAIDDILFELDDDIPF